MSTPVTLLPGTLPYDCYPSPQQLNVDIITLARAFLNQNFPGVYVGDTEPPQDQRDRIWFHTVSQKWYQYLNGLWQRTYDVPANSGENRIIRISVDAYNIEQCGSSSQPLWVLDDTLNGSVPVGIGLIPGSSPAASIAAIGDTQDTLGSKGEYKHVLTGPEMRGHWHGVGTDGAPGGGDPPIMVARGWTIAPATFVQRLEDTSGGGSWVDGSPFSSGTMGTTNPLDDAVNASDGHNNLQPFVGRIFVKRTDRVYVQPPY